MDRYCKTAKTVSSTTDLRLRFTGLLNQDQQWKQFKKRGTSKTLIAVHAKMAGIIL